MSIPFLDALLGKLYNRGAAKELRGGLNFGPGFSLVPSSYGYDVVPDPAVYVSAMRSTVLTANATPTLLPDLAVAISEFQMVRIEARFMGRETNIILVPNNSFTVLTAIFRRVEDGAAVQWGTTSTGVDLEDDATWGTPELVLSGNTVTPRVTGKFGAHITWTVDMVVRAY